MITVYLLKVYDKNDKTKTPFRYGKEVNRRIIKALEQCLCLIPFPSLAGTAIFRLRTVIVNQAVLLTRVHGFAQAFPE